MEVEGGEGNSGRGAEKAIALVRTEWFLDSWETTHIFQYNTNMRCKHPTAWRGIITAWFELVMFVPLKACLTQ